MLIVVLVASIVWSLGATIVLMLVLPPLLRRMDSLEDQVHLAGPSHLPGEAGLRTGADAPAIAGTTWEGSHFISHHPDDGYRLVLFADPGCRPCEELVPDVVASVASGSLPKAAIVVRAEAAIGNFRWPQALGVDYVLQESMAVSRLYQTDATPHAFVIDDDGTIGAQALVNSVESIRELLEMAQLTAVEVDA
jgi:hypothetical protein